VVKGDGIRDEHASAMEVRSPLLDPSLVELVADVPDEFPAPTGKTRTFSVAVLESAYPGDLGGEPTNMVFPNPGGTWLRNQLAVR